MALLLRKTKATFDSILESHIALKVSRPQWLYKAGMLRRYCDGLGISPFELQEHQCNRYAVYLMNREGHPNRSLPGRKTKVTRDTVRNHVRRWFFIWNLAIQKGILRANPWVDVYYAFRRVETCEKRPTENLEPEDVRRLLASCDPETKEGIRDHAAYSILFGCAMRVGEVVGIALCDLVRESGKTQRFVLTTTKRQAAQTQTLPSWTRESVDRLVMQRCKEGAREDGPLFPVYYGERVREQAMHHNTLRQRFKKACRSLGLKGHYTPHSGRATAVTRLLDLGVPARYVKLFARLQSTRMVERYDKRRLNKQNDPARKIYY